LYGEHPEEAVPACEDAYNIFVATGNRAGAADALRLVGDYEGFKSQYDQAIATYEKALAQLSGLGEHAKTGAVLNNMAGNYLNQGNLDRAEQLYEQAKFHFEQTGDKLNTGTAICNIADILFLRGDLPGAKKAYEQTLALAASTDRAEPWYAMYRLADLDLAEGHVQDAHRLAQQAIDQIRPIHGAYGNLTSAMTELGEILETEGDLAGARKQFQSAMEIQDKMGEKGGVMESQAELADLALEEGNAQQAESLIRPAIVEFQDEKSDPSLASAYTVLSRALLMQGKAEDARQAIDRAIQFSRTSSDPALRLPAAIQEAQVEMAGVRKDATKALEELHAAITSARKLGYYNVECEARLTLGKLQLKSNAATARAQLTALAAEARNRGLELLARRTDKELSGGDVVALNAQAH
jgi:tetratricopeptide (TPR) repeat protein